MSAWGFRPVVSCGLACGGERVSTVTAGSLPAILVQEDFLSTSLGRLGLLSGQSLRTSIEQQESLLGLTTSLKQRWFLPADTVSLECSLDGTLKYQYEMGLFSVKEFY
jgi:hypothetical protein